MAILQGLGEPLVPADQARVVAHQDQRPVVGAELGPLVLASEFEAAQELSKGKKTTDPARHSGEGIFFTSKAVELFRLTSSGAQWTVDNLRRDTALGAVPVTPGTLVQCQIDPQTDRVLADTFLEFSHDHDFIRTRVPVKLFKLGTGFVSRSEAKRLLSGLEPFEVIAPSTRHKPPW